MFIGKNYFWSQDHETALDLSQKDYIGYEPILALKNYFQIFRKKLE